MTHFIFRLIPILILLTGCSSTGYQIGSSHAVRSDGEALYHAPYFVRESEKVDLSVQYYPNVDRTEFDVMEVDWNYKF